MSIITEIKTVKVNQCIPENPFFVRWLIPVGGWDIWLFGVRQVFSLDISDTETFAPVLNYLQTANGIEETLKKDAFEFVTVGYEGLKQEDVNGLRWLLTSPKIYYVQGQPTTNDFIQLVLRVKPGSYTFLDNGDGTHKMEITFIKPKLQTQSQ